MVFTTCWITSDFIITSNVTFFNHIFCLCQGVLLVNIKIQTEKTLFSFSCYFFLVKTSNDRSLCQSCSTFSDYNVSLSTALYMWHVSEGLSTVEWFFSGKQKVMNSYLQPMLSSGLTDKLLFEMSSLYSSVAQNDSMMFKFFRNLVEVVVFFYDTNVFKNHWRGTHNFHSCTVWIPHESTTSAFMRLNVSDLF